MDGVWCSLGPANQSMWVSVCTATSATRHLPAPTPSSPYAKPAAAVSGKSAINGAKARAAKAAASSAETAGMNSVRGVPWECSRRSDQ